ncbi:hypothetical protein AB0J86_32090 [Micromonospora sp. NPDC049559]|uniref:hypothetical protein n=1 Tax=Micromonospora sp. NPDC049559 TaxID=3155923 RepID=UPI0034254E33
MNPATPPRQLVHAAQRPLWHCRMDGQPWPCGEARLFLVEDYRTDPVQTSIYLCGVLHEMIRDLYRLHPDTAPPPDVMFARVLGWLPPRRPLS